MRTIDQAGVGLAADDEVERTPTTSPTAMPPSETTTNSSAASPRLKALPVATPTAIR